jgi:hypothetical protein
MHAERAVLDPDTAARLNAVHDKGGRIVCVGHHQPAHPGKRHRARWRVHPFEGDTDIFITPGYRFRGADMLLTNFHLPRSTLFMLVSALMGLDVMKRAYAEAISQGYRFYSYGDACLLRPADDRALCMTRIGASSFWPATAPRARASSIPRGRHPHPGLHAGGNRGTVKAMLPQSVRETGADILLGTPII